MTTGTAGASDGADVLDDVFNKSGRDSGADSAAPEGQEPAPEVEAKPEAEQPKAEQNEADQVDDSQPQGRDSKTGRFVPVSELIEERKKLRAKNEEEFRLRVQAEERAKFYESQIQSFQRVAQQPPQQQIAQPELPDPFTDPQGYANAIRAQAEQVSLNEKCNFSEAMAREKHGDDLVNQALQAAQQAGVAERFVRAANPYGDMVRWFRQAQALHRIGPDPDAYEKSVEERVTAKLLADLKAGKISVNGTATQQPQRFPGTLADAVPQGHAAPVDPGAMLDSIFSREGRAKARA